MSFDRDRGVLIRNHPTGFRVGTYPDSPGVYVDERGFPVSEDIARAAGFDIKSDSMQRQRQEALRRATQQVEEQFQSVQQRLMKLAENNGEGVKIKEIVTGRFGIFDADDTLITVGMVLTWEEAVITFEGLTGNKYVSEADLPPVLDGLLPPQPASKPAGNKGGNKGNKAAEPAPAVTPPAPPADPVPPVVPPIVPPAV